MNFGRPIRRALLASTLFCAMLSPAGTSRATTFLEFVDPNPAPGNQFGAAVVPLSTGNVVITSPSDNFGGPDAGAVYLFNGSTGALISILRGSSAEDRIGSGGVTALSNGNYVIRSPGWDNGAVVNAGAATWGRGTTGVSGAVSAANSLVGSTAGDVVGSSGVTALSNGNYMVASSSWDNGAVVDAGAATRGNGAFGVSGAVSAANSLVGSTADDRIGSGGVTALSNGNYVVRSPYWNNGAVVDAGAATWGNGTTGVTGALSASNSLVGSTASDNVGSNGVTALSNGNYVVASTGWHNGAVVAAGAATWGNGTTGVTGVVSAANSLVGSTLNDQVGSGVTALTNGNYVVRSPWHTGGAATWGNGTTGVTGVVSPANSLVGSQASDEVGVLGVAALSNGNYVVVSPYWNNGAVVDAGAATWGNGTSGVTGALSAANSLVGSTLNDRVGSSDFSSGVTALSNGNYVVASSSWDNGAVVNAGAATRGNGTTGVSGVISAANSLVGSTLNDQVGISGVTALSNGNYVVGSPYWNNGAVVDAGAATWGNGTTGVTGALSASNSLVGSTASDEVGGSGVTALSNGNYVVASQGWNNGAVGAAGAATWGNGTTGVSGVISAANSLVGSTGDFVGSNGVTALSNGNYVVVSPYWNNGAVHAAGAATWGNGTTGVTGVLSASNSLVGSTAGDYVGSVLAGKYRVGVTALSNGNYVVLSGSWHNGALGDAGAATWGDGTTGVSGVVSDVNSAVGAAVDAALALITEDAVNSTFSATFFNEGGGRVRVGPVNVRPVIATALDIPNDQGGWLRLTFSRSELDILIGSPPIATYAVWRHVPGTIPAGADGASAALPDASDTERLRASIPAGLDVREVEGRFYVMGLRRHGPGIAGVMPPGTWELVASLPALQQAQYVAAVPTISNAEANDYVVTAHTTTPSLWYPSDPASGHSVDNLAPATPTLLTGAYSSGQTNLQWAANTESDLGSYRIYRGTSANFTPDAGNQIATVTSPGYGDVGPAGRFYKVSAVDVNGNQSGFALLTPEETTEVDGEPVAFALEGARPNPTNGNGLNIAFALPSGAAARLELVDVSGRQVVTREVGALGAGQHTVNLAADRRVAPGIYWVRLTQGVDQQRTRVAVIE